MTAGWFSRMTVVLSFRAIAGIQEVFFVILCLMLNPRYIPFLLVLKKKKINTGSPIELGMTVGWFSGMTVVVIYATYFCHSRDLFVIQSDCGNPGSIFCYSGLDAESKVYYLLLILMREKTLNRW